MNSTFLAFLHGYVLYFIQKFKMDHTSCKQKSYSSVIFWMTGICQFSFSRDVSFFMRRPSKKTLKKILSFCLYHSMNYFLLQPSTFFSIYPQNTVRNIQCTPERNETLWHMTKNETSLKSDATKKWY